VIDGSFALLRVSGEGATGPVALVAETDPQQFFDPLPHVAAEAEPGTWRAAFAVPAELIKSGVGLCLVGSGAERVELPAPTGGEPELEQAEIVHPQPAHEDDEAGTDRRGRKLVEAWAEAAHLREKLGDRERELADALKSVLEARSELRPLHERAEATAAELAEVRGELAEAQQDARRASQLANAEAEALRERVQQLEEGMATAQSAAAAETERLSSGLADQRKVAEKLEARLAKRESRRRGFGRRSGDRDPKQAQPDTESTIAAQRKRIEDLEQEAASFAQRLDTAVEESLREHIAAVEHELHDQAESNEDLRTLLASEGETATARGDEIEATTSEAVASPPWSAIDDELLARIEKAKSRTVT
jgi:chromosome segregation ATPase